MYEKKFKITGKRRTTATTKKKEEEEKTTKFTFYNSQFKYSKIQQPKKKTNRVLFANEKKVNICHNIYSNKLKFPPPHPTQKPLQPHA